MNYNLLRSILKTIPSHEAYAYDVNSDEALGDYLLTLAAEMRSLRQIEHEAHNAERLKALCDDLQNDIETYRGRLATANARIAELELASRFPGKSIADIADQVWAEHGVNPIEPGGPGRVIQAIKEFRAITGMSLRESKDMVEAARDRVSAKAA